MSLECLAFVGNKNEPLYMCSPVTDSSESADGMENDSFGFLDQTRGGNKALRNPSIQHEFMMHSALDRLEEILGPPKTTNYSRFQRGSHWMGSICPMEDCEIYGYVTVSDMKILALVKRQSILPLKRRKEGDIKALFINAHDCYVKYTLNPFTKIRSKIEPPCGQFEDGVAKAIEKYNEAVKAQDIKRNSIQKQE